MASDADNRARIQGIIPYQFKKGQSGNLKGRPKGTRNRLSEMFVRDLHDFWLAHGHEVLMAAAKRNPVDAANLVSKLVPQNHGVDPPKKGIGFEAIWRKMGQGAVPPMASPPHAEDAEVIGTTEAPDNATGDTTITSPR